MSPVDLATPGARLRNARYNRYSRYSRAWAVPECVGCHQQMAIYQPDIPTAQGHKDMDSIDKVGKGT